MKKNILRAVHLCAIALLCVNMGDTNKVNTINGPAFKKLEEKEGCYRVTIFDDNQKTMVRDFSFTGHTSIGGILKENDDSVNTLDIAHIKEIHIVNRDYTSMRYPTSEVSLIKVITRKGIAIENMLLPRQITICGIEISTGVQKAWTLSKITKLMIDGPCDIEKDEPIEVAPARVKGKYSPSYQADAQAARLKAEIKEELKKDLEQSIPNTKKVTSENRSEKPGIIASVFDIFEAIKSLISALVAGILSLFGL